MTPKGLAKFSALEKILKAWMIKKIIIASATDRAARLFENTKDLLHFLKQAIPHVMTINCLAHVSICCITDSLNSV